MKRKFAPLILYLAYLGGKTVLQKWNAPADKQGDEEATVHHAL